MEPGGLLSHGPPDLLAAVAHVDQPQARGEVEVLVALDVGEPAAAAAGHDPESARFDGFVPRMTAVQPYVVEADGGGKQVQSVAIGTAPPGAGHGWPLVPIGSDWHWPGGGGLSSVAGANRCAWSLQMFFHEALARGLAAHGVETVFGVLGDTNRAAAAMLSWPGIWVISSSRPRAPVRMVTARIADDGGAERFR
jgi:hypothetical protein